jgi:molybdopterin-binding protein
MGLSLLHAEGLRRHYDGRLVVAVDRLTVEPGEVVAILGPNGAGKSTLFRLLLLLERADSGRILLGGSEVGPGDSAARRRLAGVFQHPYLFAGTVEENVGYGLRIRGAPRRARRARVEEVLDEVGLTRLATAQVHTLSGGEAQRVALARALVLRPELLLLDEPTANLDIRVRRRFREDLQHLTRAHARGALLITHDPAEAFAVADRVAVMEGGRIVQTGAPDELVLEPGTPFVAAFTGAELLLNGIVEERDQQLLRVRIEGAARSVYAVMPPDGSPIEPGESVHLAYRPEDLLVVATDAGGESSARNRFQLRVTHLSPTGGLVRIRLTGEVTLIALLTRPAVESLGLVPGREVAIHLKATALRAFRASDGARPNPAGAPSPNQRDLHDPLITQ